MTKLLSQFVRVAREGATIDGREITAKQIDQMAANYDPQKYGARIWIEHMRGLLPESLFPAMGDVVALKAENDNEGKRVLLAQLAPTPKLVEINKERQKVFTSIEMDPNFSGTGEAYLVGLAVTDSPASLGTQMLAFSQRHSKDFTGTVPANPISEALDAGKLTFLEEEAPAETASVFTRVRELLSRSANTADKRFADMEASLIEMATAMDGIQTRLADLSTRAPAAPEAGTDLAKQVDTLSAQLGTLTEKLSKETNPNSPHRPEATGGNGAVVTDC